MNRTSASGVASPRLQSITASCRIPALSMLVLAASGVVVQPAATFANEDQPQEAVVEEILVTAERRFLSADTSGATNLPVPIEELPQSISLVSADFISSANLSTLADIAEHVPGATQAGSKENHLTFVKMRGFPVSRLIDGMESTGQFEPQFSIFERVEAVKGPSSVIYGVSSTGGLFNFVTKFAPAVAEGHALVRFGSWNRYRIEGEFGGPINETGSVRAIALAVHDEGDSFINIMDHTSSTAYGGIDVDISNDISMYLHGGYEYRDRVSFDGIPTFAATGDPAPVGRSFFIGSDDARLESEAYHLSSGASWEATDSLSLDIKGHYWDSATDGLAPFAFGLQPNGDFTIRGEAFEQDDTEDYSIEASALYNFDALGLDNSFVTASFRYTHTYGTTLFRNYRFPDGATSIGANLFDGEEQIAQTFESGTSADRLVGAQLETDIYTLSIQSIIEVADPISILAGVSRTDPKTVSTVDRTFSGGTVTDAEFDFEAQNSYRLGAIYEIQRGTNAYVSYSESFTPQRRRDANDNILAPLAGEQYELGIKWLSREGRLLVTGAAFEITQENEARFDQNIDGSDRFLPIGEVTHKGVELQAVGTINPQWQISAGYAWLDAEITQDSVAENVGKRRPFLPKQTANLFTTYYPSGTLENFGFGGGFRYVDNQPTTIAGDTTEIPSYFVADVYASYIVDDWTIQLNAKNIFDEHYYTNNYDTLFFGNLPGAPASVDLTVRRYFR